MVLRGLVLLCPVPPLDTTVFSRWTVERRIWSYGGWYCCASSLLSILLYSLVLMVEGRHRAPPPHSRSILLYSTNSFDDGVEGMVLRGLVLWCPLPPS